MDVLSDVLRTLELSGVIFLRAHLTGEFGVSMPPPTVSHPMVRPQTSEHRLVMFHIVQEGSGYIEVEGFKPQAIHEGDLIIVLGELYHSLVDAPGRPTIASSDLVPEFNMCAPPAVELGEGKKTLRLVCGLLEFVDRGLNPVFSALPPYLHISKDDGPDSSWLQMNLAHIIQVAESGRQGTESLLASLTELLFVETVRGHLDTLPASEMGWFAALNDPVLGKALELVHDDPAHGWTVAALAKRVGTSRSAFSARFAQVLDTTPMAYITSWRIRLATNLLQHSNESIGTVAERVGYASESAFNRAFKREMGTPPVAWRNTVASSRDAERTT
ncbi:MAG: AraC-like DNA-binding protein [Myxococcota bacterium]|jgi:AraC-like DNA-binding protein